MPQIRRVDARAGRGEMVGQQAGQDGAVGVGLKLAHALIGGARKHHLAAGARCPMRADWSCPNRRQPIRPGWPPDLHQKNKHARYHIGLEHGRGRCGVLQGAEAAALAGLQSLSIPPLIIIRQGGHVRWRSHSGSSATAKPDGVLKDHARGHQAGGTRRLAADGVPRRWPSHCRASAVYMSTLQGTKLEVYVPPTIHYGRDAGGDTELFAIPLTIANNGARSAAVLSIELEVQNLKTSTTQRCYSAFLGEHPREAATSNRQFAPLSIAGRGLFSETVRFYPAGCSPSLWMPRASTRFRLQLNTAAPHEPSLLDWLQGRAQLAANRCDDAALDLGSAAWLPARHDRHARQGLEACCGQPNPSLPVG